MASRRIAVIGMLRSGKTSLITALIDHWLNHPNGARMPLPNGNQIICKWKDPFSAGKQHFALTRQRFSDGKWPEKTLAPMSYQLQWRFKSRKRRMGISYTSSFRNLELIDVPGERLADVDMLMCNNLAKWSAHLVNQFKIDPRTQKLFQTFAQLFEQQRDEKDHAHWIDELESAYREFVAELILHQHPFVTPSSMLIDDQGSYVPVGVRKDVAKLKHWLLTSAALGVEDKRLFPLPERLLESPAGKAMCKTYRKYVKHVVLPSLAPLAGSEDVIVVADIARILQEGPIWKNTTDHFFSKIADFVEPGGLMRRTIRGSWLWLARLGTIGYYTPRCVKRVFVVATQADRVHQNYQDDLLALTKELSAANFKLLAGTSIQLLELTVSAVISTKSQPDGTIQYVRLMNGQQQEVSAIADQLPDAFPDDWNKGQFKFPICQSRMPVNQAMPSPQCGLQRLTHELLI